MVSLGRLNFVVAVAIILFLNVTKRFSKILVPQLVAIIIIAIDAM